MLRLFGVPRFDNIADLAARLPAKAFILLALLLTDHRKGISRLEAANFLWEGADQAKAYANLRQLLATITRWESLTGQSIIGRNGNALLLVGDERSSDLGTFLNAPPPMTGPDVRRLMDLSHEDLLGGIDAGGSELARWLQLKRDMMRARLAELLVAAGQGISLLELEFAFEALSSASPLDERLVRARMSNLVGLGNDAAALKVFSSFESHLRADLGARPELATRALAARIAGRQAPEVSLLTETTAGPAHGPANERPLPRIILIPPAPKAGISQDVLDMSQSLISDITLQLCRVRTFAMFAPHTARQLTRDDPLQAVAPYGMDYVISTSVLPGTVAPRLSFSVVDTATQDILMADQVALTPERLLATQEILSATLASAIAEVVASTELKQYRSTGAASAYVRYLLGSNLIQNNDLSQLRRARSHLKQALHLSPDYVPALGAMARTLSIEWLLLGRTDRDLLHEAQRLANRAIQIDPLNATGHRELGHASMYLGNLADSEQHFETALDRAPHHADILADQADILVHASRMQEAKLRIDRAMQLNPLAPDDYRWVSGSIEFFLHNYEAATTQLRNMRDQSMVDRLLAAAAAMSGDLETAHLHRDRWMARYPDFRVKDFAAFMPHRSKSDLDHFVSALARAGFA